MRTYYGTKKVAAKPMSLGEYIEYREWKMPKNEDPTKEGYLVEYLESEDAGDHPLHNHYISWSPKETFENSYRSDSNMTFGQAIKALKEGHRLTRVGWNGKNMFLYYVPESKYPASRNVHNTLLGHFPDDMVPYRAYIAMLTVDKDVVPWLASQSDILAEDWVIVG